ncbi:MAG: peptide deformylase [Candidatus Sumerlaeota bacterium]
MALRKVHIYGDPCLREVSGPVDAIDDPEIKTLIEDMVETMYEEDGIGLAAPQVGENVRIFVADTTPAEENGKGAKKRNPVVYINPEIIEESPEDGPMDEGCLSLPELSGQVYRPLQVKIRYTNGEGERVEEDLDGMAARCVQHEIDHLDGKLFIDRMPFVRRRMLAGKLNALKKRQREETAAKA